MIAESPRVGEIVLPGDSQVHGVSKVKFGAKEFCPEEKLGEESLWP